MKYIKSFKIFESSNNGEISSVIRTLADVTQNELDGSTEHISEYWEPDYLIQLSNSTNDTEIKNVLTTLAEVVQNELDGSTEHISEYWEPEYLLTLIGDVIKQVVGLEDNDLILIKLGSANSKNSRYWSLHGGYCSINTNSKESNDQITKLIAGKIDMLKFNNDYEGLYKKEFKYKSNKDYKSLIYLDEFESLNSSKKNQFFDFIKDEMLVIRSSYIYKVLNKSELPSFLSKMSNKFEEIKNN